jgi:hypothetical protein
VVGTFICDLTGQGDREGMLDIDQNEDVDSLLTEKTELASKEMEEKEESEEDRTSSSSSSSSSDAMYVGRSVRRVRLSCTRV